MDMNIKQLFLTQQPVNMSFTPVTKKMDEKSADAMFDANGKLAPGWAEPTFDDFFTKLDEEPVLLDQSRMIKMTSAQHDLDDLDADLDFQAQRDTTTGNSLKLTDTEIPIKRTRKQLTAQALQAMTVVTQNFIDENIENDGFMSTLMNLLGNKTGPAMERWGIYSDPNGTLATGEANGFAMTKGLIAQAIDIKKDNDTDANGLANLVYSDDVVGGLLDAAEMYVEQDGNMKNANIVVPPIMYTRAVRDIATRETDYGDAILKDGKIPMIMGMEVVQDNTLRETRNGFDKMKFTNGEYKANGTNVTDMRYAFIGEPSNIAFGMMRDIQMYSQWDIREIGYIVAILAKADAKIHRDEDTLIVPFTKNEKSNS